MLVFFYSLKADPCGCTGNMQSSAAAIMQSANLFAFTSNNPVRWVDPTGLVQTCQCCNSHDTNSRGDTRVRESFIRYRSAGGSSSSILVTSDLDVLFGWRSTFTPYVDQFTTLNNALAAFRSTFHGRSGPNMSFWFPGHGYGEFFSWIYRDSNTGLYMFGEVTQSVGGSAPVYQPRFRKDQVWHSNHNPALAAVGWIHTHPYTGNSAIDAGREHFSGAFLHNGRLLGDGITANYTMLPGFLVTPRGLVNRLDPSWTMQVTSHISNNSRYVRNVLPGLR